jgi:anti-anti-sigma regulatory factor
MMLSGEGAQRMRLGFQVLPHAVIVRIFGVVDQSLGEMIEKATERAVFLNKRQVVIDFSDIESIDAAGLVLCGFGLHHFRKLGIPVALVKPPTSLLLVLQEHGLSEVPPVFFAAESVPCLN